MPWKLVIEIVSIIGGVATLIALMLGPMFYLGSKIEKVRDKIDEVKNKLDADMNEIRKENKDFHGRLCAIEERNKQ